jgi:death-on-curing protein
MDLLLPGIQNEYERWLKIAGADDSPHAPRSIGIKDVLWAHFVLIDYFVREGEGYGGVGPRDLNLLHSAIHRQFVGFGHRRKWEADLDKCATLFYGLIMDHPFHDCNKRTAFLVLLYHLDLLGRCPAAKQRDFENLAVRTADHRLNDYLAFRRFKEQDDAEVLFISDFLHRHTRAIDKREYIITYNNLDTILRQFDCRLANPDGNYIDVEKVTKTRTWFSRPKVEYKKVAQIGFPGMTRQVGKGAIHTVRQATGLTPENGVDSQVFYRGVSPISALVDRFRIPLKRLADR